MAEKKNEASRATGKISDVGKKIVNGEEKVSYALTSFFSKNLREIIENKLLEAISPFTRVQNAAIDLAKSMGLAGKSIMSNSIRLVEQNRKMQLSRSYGISNKEMMELQTKVMGGLGRNVQIDQVGTATPENPNFDSTLENIVAANQVFGPERVAEIIAGYDKLGVSMKSAAKATGKLYKEAGEYGINLEKYTENFTKNLDMAQTYSFRNGINGLKEMARKATEIRQDMRQIAAFADKVGSVTGAVETAANLQVLGGSFAALANPLTMLNKSLTDVNGLQEMFNGMSEGAATYNSVTHEIEMDPVTRQIMKRAAESMGVDPAKFIDQAYAQARRAEVSKQMDGIGNLRDDVKKMLPNIAEIDSETGAAGATIDGEFKTLAEIAANPELQQQLVDEARSESEDIKVIAKSVMGIEDIVSGLFGQLENEEARNVFMPGIISGKSPIDLQMDLLTKSINEDTIAGAGKLSRLGLNIRQAFWSFLGSGLSELAKPLSSSNPEEFAQKLGEGASNTLGETTRKYGEEMGGWVANAVEKVAEKLEEYGITLTDILQSTEYEGKAGRTTPIEKPKLKQDEVSSVALAARDVAIEATNFSFNGGQSTQISPLNTEEISRATAAIQGDTNQILGEVQTIATGLGNAAATPSGALLNDIKTNRSNVIVRENNKSITDTANQTLASSSSHTSAAPVAPITANGQTITEIKASETSIPGVTVAPTGNKIQATSPDLQGTGARQNGNNGPYTLNITGTLTMNVNGDNGKIGTVDIIKMLENNQSFRQELAKAFADTYAKMDKSGLVSN